MIPVQHDDILPAFLQHKHLTNAPQIPEEQPKPTSAPDHQASVPADQPADLPVEPTPDPVTLEQHRQRKPVRERWVLTEDLPPVPAPTPPEAQRGAPPGQPTAGTHRQVPAAPPGHDVIKQLKLKEAMGQILSMMLEHISPS